MCQPCKGVKRWLDKRGVAYEEKQLLDHPEKIEEFRQAELMQTPVVESDVRPTFSGFNPDALQEIVDALKE